MNGKKKWGLVGLKDNDNAGAIIYNLLLAIQDSQSGSHMSISKPIGRTAKGTLKKGRQAYCKVCIFMRGSCHPIYRKPAIECLHLISSKQLGNNDTFPIL